MSGETDEEKKHAPTQERLRKAREEGQIKRSNDLPKAAITLGLILVVFISGGALSGLASRWFAASIAAVGSLNPQAVRGLDLEFAAVLGAFLVATGVLAFVAGLGSGGWMMSFMLLMPKMERVDPAKSWGQIFSVQNLIEVGKSGLKIIFIGGSGWLAYTNQEFQLLALANARQISIATLGGPALHVVLAAAGGALVLAVADIGIQAWMSRRSLRMTDKEMKDESKKNDGDPHVRARRRAIMRKAAKARQIQSVKTATMVITNPTHFAVAVRYRRGTERVPTVIAKGADLNATPIIEQARLHGIPLVEAPPLARALHRQVQIGKPIPSHLYTAVAELLAYIWRMDSWRAAGGARPVRPKFPDALEKLGPAAR
ncbi:flagellar biosynthesis protein FlhB [Thioclava sp. BHET1]|nr:flagellar biosynthesis protein FlhB [Thioclava sp. BHET1]